jgi:perosamine synthetase
MIPRFKPYLGREEFKEIFRHQSDSVRRFEDEFARTFEAQHALAFPYGRSALWAFFEAFDIKGVEIILPAYTCVVVAHAIVLSGNIPRFVDVSPNDFNMDLDQVEAAINERTGAVIATHLFGYPLDVDRMNQVVRQAEIKYGKKIWIIQDCAHGFGTRWKGRLVCNEGDLALFGLNISKMITSIFGGMLTSLDRETAERLGQWREDHFFPTNAWRSIRRRAYLLAVYPAFQERIYSAVNWLEEKTILLNYYTKAYHLDSDIHFPSDHRQQMSSVEAQVGMEQLKKYPEIVRRRRELARLYHAQLSDSPGINLPPLEEGATWSHFSIRVGKREEVLRRLRQKGIQLGHLVEYSIPELPGYRSYVADASFPNAARCSRETINLPIYPQLDMKKYQKIVREIQKVYSHMN